MNRKTAVKRTLIYFICVLLTVITIAPILIGLVNATKNREEIYYGEAGNLFLPSDSLRHNFEVVFIIRIGGQVFPMVKALKNSLMVAATSAIFSTLISSLTAYGFAMYRFKGRKLLYGLIFVALAFPMNLSVLGYVGIIRTMGLFNTLWALIIHGLASPLTIFLMERYISSTVNREIVEAGRIDGASEIRIFRELITPIITPAIALSALFAFISSWNDYLFSGALLKSYEKFTVPLIQDMIKSSKYQPEPGAMFLVIALNLIAVGAVYLIFSRYVLRGTGFAGEVIYAEFKE